MLKEDFLESYLQYKLEEALVTAAIPSPDERPFDNLYTARKMIEEVKNDPILTDDDIDAVCFKGVATYLLGLNYFETDEIADTRKELKAALDIFSRIPFSRAINFLNIFQEIFNIFGLLELNADNNAEGFAWLTKAEKIHEKITEVLKDTQITCYTSMDMYSYKRRLLNASPEERDLDKKTYKLYSLYGDPKPVFRFFYQGGLCIEKNEESFTLTCFYLAQANVKLSNTDAAAHFSAVTLQRQLASGQYDITEWCNNSMGLAEYYKQERFFSQAMYVMFVAMSILPEGKKKKTRASIHIMMGNILLEFFEYNGSLIRSGLQEKPLAEFEQLESYLNTKKIEFEDSNVSFPKNRVYKNIEDIKHLFKMTMTQYNKAAETYVLDGFVTEYTNIHRMKAKLYALMGNLENDDNRKFAINIKRKELIKSLYSQLSPKHFINTWRELCIELAEICNFLFELRRNELFMNAKDQPNYKDKATRKKLLQMNENGMESISVYQQILDFFNSADYKSEENNDDYIQSVVNAKFAMAKIYNALMSGKLEERVGFLKKSLEHYQFIKDFIKQKGQEKGTLAFSFSEQLRMCNEMTELLPVKIDKLLSGAYK